MTAPVLLGVCGWPVGHSRSPAIHNAALAATGLSGWSYERLAVPPERFASAIATLADEGYRGLNVTIPHKEVALALAGEASPSARAIGAANTLSFAPDGRVRADNTDAPGLLAALPPDFAPEGRSALVLGAGGAARAVVWALRRAGAAEVAVWNRTPARAEALAEELGARAVPEPVTAELIVNCTSVGLEDGYAMPPLAADSLRSGVCVVDLVYRPGGTGLLAEAEQAGARTVDGLAVLVEQGAASFELWTGRPAPRAVMRAAAEAAP